MMEIRNPNRKEALDKLTKLIFKELDLFLNRDLLYDH
jgi:hypothetical protein